MSHVLHFSEKNVTPLHTRNQKCVTWLVHKCDTTHFCVCRDLFTCATWFIRMFNKPYTHVRHDSKPLKEALQRTAMHCNALQLTATNCNMPHAYVRQDSFACITCLIHINNIYTTWLIRMCAETLSHMRHDLFACATCLIHVGAMTQNLVRSAVTHCYSPQPTATHCNKLHNTHDWIPRTTHHWGDTAATCNSLRLTATQCNSLQLTATRCNSLQLTATHCNSLQLTATHCNSLQLTATHCNSLQLTATNCNSLQLTATHCNSLHLTATHCNKLPALQLTTTQCNSLQLAATRFNSLQLFSTRCNPATRCNSPQRIATHCISLQLTAAH